MARPLPALSVAILALVRERPLRPLEIAQMLGIAPSAVRRNVSAMVRRGRLIRIGASADAPVRPSREEPRAPTQREGSIEVAGAPYALGFRWPIGLSSRDR